MVFKKPDKSTPIQASSNPNAAGQARPEKKVITVGTSGDHGGQGQSPRGGGGNGNPSDDRPSPWLVEPQCQLDPTASFVEYLRWMRSPDPIHKDPTKVQILQMAEEKANYRDRLEQLTNRTKLIAGAGNTFEVQCPWRIRVGGAHGPENILLPAFDALGMPYIPSSTLRGVARTQAIRELMATENLEWKQAEEQVARQYFGYLDSQKGEERAGKVIFLDAYPLPTHSRSGGLAVDMANSIWSWDDGGQQVGYSPNPNPFLSLEKATFVIGLRAASHGDAAILEQVKQWLCRGLQGGIGAQVNTGYGRLVRPGQAELIDGFFSVEFTVEGQLIHGQQKFTQWNWNDRNQRWQMRGQPDAEVRPVAFKSMLRYWFRVLALGVLPSKAVQTFEGKLFGAITPKQRQGWIAVRIADGKVVQREARPNAQGKRDPCGVQTGKLVLTYSTAAPSEQKDSLESLLRNLTWLMFHLGGIGQGARRPCYSRKSRDRAPWWRGSTLIPETEDAFWHLPESTAAFQQRFRQRLQGFYEALDQIVDCPVNPSEPIALEKGRRDRWIEAVDYHCRIVVCSGNEDFGKPYALAVLHSQDLKVTNRQGQRDYDENLCGHAGNKDVKPSPVWINDLGDYQVVTVFGANQDPRRRYLQTLREQSHQYRPIWPL